MAADLVMTCMLGNINLDGGRDNNGYELHGDTRATMGVTWRKQSVSNPWVEGSYDVIAVRENVTEALAVWVYGTPSNGPATAAGNSAFRQRVNVLEALIAKPQFNIVFTVGDLTETWDCTYSDYTIETSREFQYATQGVMRMQINRRPAVLRAFADGTTVRA